jgi:thiamine biosynthesis protein ThiS
MKININGTPKEIDRDLRLAELVTKFCKQPKFIVTAVNDGIVLAEDRENIILKEGDSVELVAPVGGG